VGSVPAASPITGKNESSSEEPAGIHSKLPCFQASGKKVCTLSPCHCRKAWNRYLMLESVNLSPFPATAVIFIFPRRIPFSLLLSNHF